MMWSKVKSILRKLKVRVSEALSDAIDFAFSEVSAFDCNGWYSSCLCA